MNDGKMTDYEMEELVPIVGRLAEKYTAFESTSIPYETAEQLMGAVLYCIRESEQQGRHPVAIVEGRSALQAYEAGAAYVKEKAKMALGLYNGVLQGFSSYGNHCLHETVVKGLPEFFRRYDPVFWPQDTILTLDYPVLRDLSAYTGIDRIYEYISCIRLEQIFLGKFPESYVIQALSKYSCMYQDMAENLCEIVFAAVIGHILAKKPLSEHHFADSDYVRIQEWFSKVNQQDEKDQLKDVVEAFLTEYYADEEDLLGYLAGAMDGIVARMQQFR